MTVHVRTTARQNHFVLTLANERRVEDRQGKERRWTGFKECLVWGRGQADVGKEGRRESILFWFFTVKTNHLIKSDIL